MRLFYSLNQLVLKTLSEAARVDTEGVASILSIPVKTAELFVGLDKKAIDNLCKRDAPLIKLDCSLLRCSFPKALKRLENGESTRSVGFGFHSDSELIEFQTFSTINAAFVSGLAIGLKSGGSESGAVMRMGLKVADAEALIETEPLVWSKLGAIGVPIFSLRTTSHEMLENLLGPNPSDFYLTRYLSTH